MLLYELDTLQRELEKAQVNTTRFQHEKEDFEVDAGRQREKNDKLQVGRKASGSARNKMYSPPGNGMGAASEARP